MGRKFKVNEKVRITATGNTGIVKSKETVKLADGHVNIHYVVKEGEGFDRWHSYKRKELEHIGHKGKAAGTLLKTYNLDSRKLTLCASVKKVNKKLLVLKVSYSICHPQDAYCEQTGRKIAERRLKHGKYDVYALPDCEFDSDFIVDILDAKACFIITHIEKYIK